MPVMRCKGFHIWDRALKCAVRGENRILVKIVLEQEDVNPNQAATRYGRTRLSLAAKAKRGVVKMPSG